MYHLALKNARLRKHDTQRQTADKLGVKVSEVQRLERGDKLPTVEQLQAYVDMYGSKTAVEYFLTGQ